MLGDLLSEEGSNRTNWRFSGSVVLKEPRLVMTKKIQ